MIKFTIMQLNCHRQSIVVEAALGDERLREVDVLCVQEPAGAAGDVIQHRDWVAFGDLRPTRRDEMDDEAARARFHPHPRVITYVSRRVMTAGAAVVGRYHPDVLSVSLEMQRQARQDESDDDDVKRVIIHNIYNPHRSALSVGPMLANLAATQDRQSEHAVIGDFNAHHPIWQDQKPGQNITQAAEALALAFTSYDLKLATPRNCTTWVAVPPASSSWTLDLCLLTNRLSKSLASCRVRPDWNHASDHQAVVTVLELSPRRPMTSKRYNMRQCNAEAFVRVVAEKWEAKREGLRPLAEDAAEWASALQCATSDALGAVVPLCKPSSRQNAWFTPRLHAMRCRYNQLCRIWKRYRRTEGRDGETEEEVASRLDARARVSRARTEYGNAIKHAKSEHRREGLARAGAELWNLAKVSRGLSQATVVAALSLDDGSVAQTPEDKELACRAAFFPAQPDDEEMEVEEELLEQAQPREAAVWRPFSEEEVRRRIKKSRRDTAPGVDLIPWSAHRILARDWADYVPLLTSIFNACIDSQVHPAAYKQARTVVLRKPGKASYNATGAYRPITLLPTTAKLLEALVASRVLQLAEENGWTLSPNHHGGRPGRSPEDSHLFVNSFVKDALAGGKGVLLIKTDAVGAYSHVRERPARRDMQMAGWPEQVQGWFVDFMRDRTTVLQVGDFVGGKFDSSRGVPQGSPASQVLWSCYSGGLADAGGRSVRGKPVLSVGWVDDQTIAITTDKGDAECVSARARMQGIADRMESWRRLHGAKFDERKTCIMLIQRPRSARLSVGPIYLGEMLVPQVESCDILGVRYQRNSRFDQQCSRAVARGIKGIGHLLTLGGRTWGLSLINRHRLFTAGVLPRLLFGISSWLPPAGNRRSGRVGMLKQITTVLRAGGLAITGAMRTTSTLALEHEASLPSAEALVDKHQARHFVRLQLVPPNHPLAPLVDRACVRDRITYPSALQLIARANPAAKLANLPRFAIKRRPDWPVPPIIVDPTKEQAIGRHTELLAEPCIRVYTDGSKDGWDVGAAAVRAGQAPGPEWHIARLRLCSSATIATAESRAVDLALTLIEETGEPTKALIFSDSQAVVYGVGQIALQHRRVRLLQDRMHSMIQRGWDLTLIWVPGHMGVPGNAVADEHAGLASREGRAEDEQFTELYSVHRAIRESIAETWEQRWTTATTASQLKQIVREPVIGSTLRLHDGLSRRQSATLVQARTGHIAFNKHLHKRKQRDNAACGCGERVESRAHVFLQCVRWEQERGALELTMRRMERHDIVAMLNSENSVTIRAAVRLAQARLDWGREQRLARIEREAREADEARLADEAEAEAQLGGL